MKLKHLIEELKKTPGDYSVELSRVFAVSEGKEVYDIKLDFPIIGVGQNDETKEVALVVAGYTPQEIAALHKFGKVKTFNEDE